MFERLSNLLSKDDRNVPNELVDLANYSSDVYVGNDSFFQLDIIIQRRQIEDKDKIVQFYQCENE